MWRSHRGHLLIGQGHDSNVNKWRIFVLVLLTLISFYLLLFRKRRLEFLTPRLCIFVYKMISKSLVLLAFRISLLQVSDQPASPVREWPTHYISVLGWPHISTLTWGLASRMFARDLMLVQPYKWSNFRLKLTRILWIKINLQ